MTKKHFLEKKFNHHSWFKEGVTVQYALDYFAKCGDFLLDKKPSKKQSDKLFDPIIYDDILRYRGKEKGTYRLTQEEKEYFLERKDYWNKQKEIQYNEWLNNEIDIDEELDKYLCSNTLYQLENKQKQLNYWKNFKVDEKTIKEYNIDEREKIRLIKSWEDRIKMTNITKEIIDKLICQYKNKVKTNKDFKKFQSIIDEELSKVVEWNLDKASWELII